MLRVMLVDDKSIIMDGLEVIIEWENLGYSVVAKATSAAEAIEIAKKQKIDLIISDIKMPEMTGLEMIRELNLIKPGCKYIIITGYGEFEYAKQAIDFQISGYLLKPIEEKELTEVLKRVKMEIEKEAEYINQKKLRCLSDIIEGRTVWEEDIKAFSGGKDMRYISVNVLYKDLIPLNNQVKCENISEAIYEYSLKNKSCYVINSSGDKTELIFDAVSYEGNIRRFLENLRQHIIKTGFLNFVILVGASCDKVENIGVSKETVNSLVDVLFYEDDKEILIYEDYANRKYNDSLIDKTITDKFFSAIRTMDGGALKNSIEEFHEEIVKKKVHPELVKNYVNQFVFDASNFMNEAGGEIAGIMYRWSRFKKADILTHKKIYMFMMDLATEYDTTLVKAGNSDVMRIVDYVKEYVNKNYSDSELSLQMLAKKHHISSAYLGKIFKEQNGENFKSYLMKIRMEKAKSLLRNSDYKIYKIANMVGFVDANYFYTKFQDYEKVTPTRYRELNNK